MQIAIGSPVRMQNRQWLLFWSCLSLLPWLVSTAQAESIRLSGTGMLLTAIRLVTDDYRQSHPAMQFQFHLPPVGSSGAIKAVINGQLDIALTGRPLKKEEEAGLVQEWLGRTPFVFIAHPSVPVGRVTLDQLVEIYAGRQKHWPDGSRIRLILRPLADADTAIMTGISPAMKEAITTAHANRPPGVALADTDIDLVDMVEKVPGGVGSVAFALLLAEKRPLKPLILDGVAPTVEAMEQHRYLHDKPAYLVTRVDAPSVVRDVVDYLRSATGKAKLAQLGISATSR
ncbi:MAG: substrate-binding domain-containing protein [Magnetococcales bacterium]|nr:substrate-binding domain-containing protein [Magnetococcales bacterium]